VFGIRDRTPARATLPRVASHARPRSPDRDATPQRSSDAAARVQTARRVGGWGFVCRRRGDGEVQLRAGRKRRGMSYPGLFCLFSGGICLQLTIDGDVVPEMRGDARRPRIGWEQPLIGRSSCSYPVCLRCSCCANNVCTRARFNWLCVSDHVHVIPLVGSRRQWCLLPWLCPRIWSPRIPALQISDSAKHKAFQ
jgi:hypothetical protein